MPKTRPVTMLVSYYPKEGKERILLTAVLESMQLARVERVAARPGGGRRLEPKSRLSVR